MPFDSVPTHRGLVVAAGGAVAASQPLAVSAAVAVLARGGAFADAALAASAVLCVVEPWNSHLGGDAFLVVHDAARRENVAFNGSGAAPASATRESYGEAIPLQGIRASTVPGLVSAWFALHERYGRLPIAELLAPAIGYARDGFPAGPRYVAVFSGASALLAERPSLCALGGHPGVRLGETIRQPELAATLERIAREGRAGFYGGPVAEKIAARGHFSLDDLAAHATRVLPPLSVRYRDLLVYGQPPPSQGMILLEELALAQGYDLAALDPVERMHVMVECKKLAFADRNATLGDPEWRAVPTDRLLSPGFAARRRRAIDLRRASEAVGAGALDEGADTTYFLVADRAGNAVSFIQSIFHGFGCAEVVPGTGVLLNNRLTGFSLDPASPNVVAPGKRPAHTLNAWLATRAEDGALAYVGGTPGGHVQVQSNFQLLVNLVEGGMNPQQATEAPRWQHLSSASAVTSAPEEAGILEIEERVGAAAIEGLRQLGHDARAIGPWAHGSSVQLLQTLPGGAVAVGSDPRCDGHASGI